MRAMSIPEVLCGLSSSRSLNEEGFILGQVFVLERRSHDVLVLRFCKSLIAISEGVA